MIQKKNGNSAFRRNLKLEPFFIFALCTHYTCSFSMNYNVLSSFCGTPNILWIAFQRMREINQKKTEGERPMCMCEVVLFSVAVLLFFRLISSRCSFVIRLFCDWFYAFCSTTLAYTVFKYGFNRLCCVWTFLLCKYTPDPTENKQQLICSLSLSLCVCVYVCT